MGSFSTLYFCKVSLASSKVVPTDAVIKFSLVMTCPIAWSKFFSNRKSLLVKMPTKRDPSVIGTPEI